MIRGKSHLYVALIVWVGMALDDGRVVCAIVTTAVTSVRFTFSVGVMIVSVGMALDDGRVVCAIVATAVTSVKSWRCLLLEVIVLAVILRAN